eukprot:CAMPEP_0184989004 /NCGR_PEP_ID=MMETSP1098-20130426/26488_1 /TAXON_ID=89044 /ORGANISM="Spumella elongata, Strain CCAP 955/1" /LENGTH=318 /DNA_ID=CAMNT_0027513883 /DNA_START=76 /DNA_END=1032 /DNA_ORIENTATION=+
MDLKRKREDDEHDSVEQRMERRVAHHLNLNERGSNGELAKDRTEGREVDLFHLITIDNSQTDLSVDAFQRLVNSNRSCKDSLLHESDIVCPLVPLDATYSQLRSLAYQSQRVSEPTHRELATSPSITNKSEDTTNVSVICNLTSNPESSTARAASIPSSSSVHRVAKATMYFDGGALGNPGKAGAGYLLYPESAQPPHIASVEPFVKAAVRMNGICTNNQAEYVGLIHGLQAAIAHKVTHLTVYGDSELVIKQMKGLYKVKNPILQVLNVKAQSLANQLTSVSYNWVERSKNKPADALSNVAMYQPDSAEECADFAGK